MNPGPAALGALADWHAKKAQALRAWGAALGSNPDALHINVVSNLVGGQPCKVGEFPECGFAGVYSAAAGAILSRGSCVLIHPRIALTAAHLPSGIDTAVFNVVSENRLEDGPQIFSVTRIPHPDYQPRALVNDIAILVLEHAAAGPVQPVSPAPQSAFATIDSVCCVGFGATTAGGSGAGSQQKAVLQLKFPLGADVPSSAATGLGFNPATECIVGGSGIGACTEDSGAPGYSSCSTDRRLVGLVSREVKTVVQGCGYGTIMTLVQPHWDFIHHAALEQGIDLGPYPV